MCGIYVTVARYVSGLLSDDCSLQRAPPEWLRRRGPDGWNHVIVRSYFHKSSFALEQVDVVEVLFFASVLSMRSMFVQQPIDLLSLKKPNETNPLFLDEAQPLKDFQPTVYSDCADASDTDSKDCAYLAWNGEVYEFFSIESNSVVPTYSHKISDTDLVCSLLSKRVTFADTTPCYQQEQIAHVMGQLVNAEYAFCIATKECIFYGRDDLGRRSLLAGTSTSSSIPTLPCPQWFLASVAASSSSITDIVWNEVEPGLVHAYELNPKPADLLKPLKYIPVHELSSPWMGSPVFSPCHLADRQVNMENASQHFHSLLLEAVRRRCGHATIGPEDNCFSMETAVLFSGGLDSAVIAALALETGVSLLTLLTVSFIDSEDTDSVPVAAADAEAAKQTYLELCQLYPNATINFVHRIVDWDDVVSVETCLHMLAFPKTDSAMDLNIATALWFAASASENRIENERSRILLSGLGADELLGGYGRHRKAWSRGGNKQLQNELNIDLNRLWERNLGRDDRILSDSGKEVRFPFLDVNVVQFIQQLALQYIVDYTMDAGKGDKLILRLVAQRIGLKTASCAIKRAIQFGSRISHVCDKRRFGSRRKANCLTKRI